MRLATKPGSPVIGTISVPIAYSGDFAMRIFPLKAKIPAGKVPVCDGRIILQRFIRLGMCETSNQMVQCVEYAVRAQEDVDHWKKIEGFCEGDEVPPPRVLDF